MIEHKLSNKTKSATVAEPKLFRQLNNSEMGMVPRLASRRNRKLPSGGVARKCKQIMKESCRSSAIQSDGDM
jgi:hypothetical protein